jgi:transposase-like protein
MDLSAFVGKLLEEQDGDVLREGIRVLSQALMETEVAGLIGAERHERTGDRSAYRNGYSRRVCEPIDGEPRLHHWRDDEVPLAVWVGERFKSSPVTWISPRRSGTCI